MAAKSAAKSGTRKRTAATEIGAVRTLTLRELNRATLQRQLLLKRAHSLSVAAAVRQLVGLQAQVPGPPYIGLWTRLATFERAALADELAAHALVRATLLRGTLHLCTAEDYASFRGVLQPMLSKGLQSVLRGRMQGIDAAALAADARQALEDGPRTFTELRRFLAARHPELDERAMGYAVRMSLPLVQVPGAGAWGFASDPQFTLADLWLGRQLRTEQELKPLIRRYLAAFGPATLRDFQTWSGLSVPAETAAQLRPELRVFQTEEGRELFDLEDAPLPDGDTAAPPRFLPEYDNLMLGHADRTRVIPTEYKPQIFLSALRVRSTFLIDGFVQGAWRIERSKKKNANSAALILEPFAALTKPDLKALIDEGERLVRFVEPDAQSYEVRTEKAESP